MISKLKLALTVVTTFIFSGFVSETYISNAIAASEKVAIEKQAKDKVTEIYPQFIKIVNDGANEATMMSFAQDNMDTAAISKRFCGANNEQLINSIIKFLIWRLKTEAIQSVKDYKLSPNMQSVAKTKIVEVKCKLNKSASEEVNMTIIFSKNGSTLGKIREIKILEIPLIEGAKTPMKKYFESNGIKIEAIKDASIRAQKCCEALDDFIKSHAK